MNRFFKIPAGAVILSTPNAVDIYVKTELVRSWYREVRNGEQVVVLEGVDITVVHDGEWSQQLESCVGGCESGDGPITQGGTIRTAYGGMIDRDPFTFTTISFDQPDTWHMLDGSCIDLAAYSPEGTDEYGYDLVENSMTLSWDDPKPANGSYTSVLVSRSAYW